MKASKLLRTNRMPNRLQSFLKKLSHFILSRMKPQDEPDLPLEQEEGNPYLFALREIMEQILKQKNIPYGQFAPALIDGDDSKYTLWAAELLGRDLNRLAILTDRPAYFEEYADNMYEEYGLIAEFFPKDSKRAAELPVNAILDFQEAGSDALAEYFEKKIYIPIFKRKWERAGSLDIAVPIGYNTVTVRVRETAEGRQCR